jgi:hypothetical protein
MIGPKDPWPIVRAYVHPLDNLLVPDPVPMDRATADRLADEHGGTIEELEPKDKTP